MFLSAKKEKNSLKEDLHAEAAVNNGKPEREIRARCQTLRTPPKSITPRSTAREGRQQTGSAFSAPISRAKSRCIWGLVVFSPKLLNVYTEQYSQDRSKRKCDTRLRLISFQQFHMLFQSLSRPKVTHLFLFTGSLIDVSCMPIVLIMSLGR